MSDEQQSDSDRRRSLQLVAFAAAILYFAFASVSASSVPGGSDQPTRVTTGLSAPRGG